MNQWMKSINVYILTLLCKTLNYLNNLNYKDIFIEGCYVRILVDNYKNLIRVS
jgi:hypothetical protein